MKNNKVVNFLKNSGLVMLFSLTLTACNSRRNLSDKDNANINRKVDSAVNENAHYRLAIKVIEYYATESVKLHNINKDIVKECAEKYIKQNIIDAYLRNLMLNALQAQDEVYGCVYINSNDDIEVIKNTIYAVQEIRKYNNWFDDLIAYLNGNVTDAQFLNTDFFKVIDNKVAYKKFKHNTELIINMKNIADQATKQSSDIYTNTWNKYALEYKKQR